MASNHIFFQNGIPELTDGSERIYKLCSTCDYCDRAAESFERGLTFDFAASFAGGFAYCLAYLLAMELAPLFAVLLTCRFTCHFACLLA